jgi:aminoglycoside phosphotransferase (APT) family kinase protein
MIPAADCAIDPVLVRTLLSEQHPDLARLAIEPAACGWDNEIYRLGAALAVRLPRRAAAAPLLANEQRWLGPVAACLPLRAPVPLRIGRPAGAYPYAWSVIPWLAGAPLDSVAPTTDAAVALADFLLALHRPAPAEAPRNPVRGCALLDRAQAMAVRLDRLQDGRHAFGTEARELWQRALAAPMDVPMTWIHGDLHAQNVLVDAGSWCAVIDWGDMAAGDPATDLAAVWMLIADRGERRRALDLYGASAETALRAKGWALNFAAVFLDAGSGVDARLARMGEHTLRRVLEGS